MTEKNDCTGDEDDDFLCRLQQQWQYVAVPLERTRSLLKFLSFLKQKHEEVAWERGRQTARQKIKSFFYFTLEQFLLFFFLLFKTGAVWQRLNAGEGEISRLSRGMREDEKYISKSVLCYLTWVLMFIIFTPMAARQQWPISEIDSHCDYRCEITGT